ncbi:efflux transporter periplasmic adaptor subunit [Planctomycetales bacterium ZRK34]|nr:efflux transporter periplasmic adaptor subunit [Planctomycetales bacterium ZRK34]
MSTMSPSQTETAAAPRSSSRRGLWIGGGAVVLIAIVVTLLALSLGGSAPASARMTDMPLYTVKRGPLTISVDVGGSIRSSQAVIIKSEVEGRATILSIVEEGSHVKAGDLLVEMDASDLEDRRIDQEISVQGAEASYIQTRENLEVVKQQAKADISAAEVDLKLAKLDLEKYEQGEYLDLVREAKKKITLAQSALKLAADKLNWSKKLHEEGYITLDEYQRDEFDHQSAELDLESAKSKLSLLQKYTYQRELAQLKSDVEQREFLLTKAKHKASSNIVDAEASYRAKEASFRRENEKLEKIMDQIAKCRIVSPVDGMVVYADRSNRWGRSDDEPLGTGVEVSQRQELMRLPTTAQMVADVKIHEAVFNKVSVGLPVRITSDALPGKVFLGVVHKIATQPDQQSIWLNPDLKVFNTEIEIQGDTSVMRPGMSCLAQIVVQQLDDVLYVPVQAMLRVNGKPTVYVPTPEGPKPRPVEIGYDNNRMVHIMSGLEVGDKVLLAPPLPPSALPTRGPRLPGNGEGGKPGGKASGPKSNQSGDSQPRQQPDRTGAEGERPKRPEGQRPQGQGSNPRPTAS